MDIGNRLPKQHRDILRELMSTEMLMQFAESSKMSWSTVRGLVYGVTTITEENHGIIDGLVKIAFEVRDSKIIELEKMTPKLQEFKNSYQNFITNKIDSY